MPEPVPAPIVAGLERLGQALTAWVPPHRDARLATHEEGVLQAALVTIDEKKRKVKSYQLVNG